MHAPRTSRRISHKPRAALPRRTAVSGANMIAPVCERRRSPMHLLIGWMTGQNGASSFCCASVLLLAKFRSKTKGRGYAALIKSAALSAIMMVGALVLPPTSIGMTEASTIRSPCSPRTRSFGSTTAVSSTPILQVPTG